MTIPVTIIEGDGIGPEIMDATLSVLEALGLPFDFQHYTAGIKALESEGDLLPEKLINNIRQTKLALKAPLATPVGTGFRSINVRLREEFKLYANVRPAKSYISGGRYEDIDLILIRENLEGLYVGVEHYIPIDDDPKAVAEASGIITRNGCRRIAEFAFDYALKQGRERVTIVHKANILKALTGLFLETAQEIGKNYAGKLEIDDRIVDNTAMQLVVNPSQFDVLLTTNMFGDILSDQIAGLVGGLGLAPGGNIGRDAAIFEAVHGSAPDIAGQGIANPAALILAAAMLLDHLGESEQGNRLRTAVANTLGDENKRTRDLGGPCDTKVFTQHIIAELA